MNNAADILAELAECCRLAYAQGLVGGTGGNMSVRIGEEVYITATGCRLGDVLPETLSRVSMDGTLLEGAQPSKELILHAGIYRVRPDVKAVVHLHPVNSIVVSILASGKGEPMPAYTPGYRMKIPFCGMSQFFIPGSAELANALAEAALKADVILMKNHGITAMAHSPKAALSLVEEAEQNALLHVMLKGQGALP